MHTLSPVFVNAVLLSLSLLTLLHRTSHPPRFACVRWRQDVELNTLHARLHVTTICCHAQALPLTDEACWLYCACVYLTPLFTSSWLPRFALHRFLGEWRLSHLKQSGINAKICHSRFILGIINVDFETKGGCSFRADVAYGQSVGLVNWGCGFESRVRQELSVEGVNNERSLHLWYHDWGETVEQGTEPRASQQWLPTAPVVCVCTWMG